MPRGSREILPPGDVRDNRTVEEADGRDHRARADRARAVRPVDVDPPITGGLVPGQGADLGLELDVPAQVERVGDPVEVFHVLPPLAERIRIGEVDAEDVGVGTAGRVDAGAGIAVLPPGAADAGVLLDHGDREPGPAQLQGGVEPAHPGADDRDGEVVQPCRIRRLAPAQRPRRWVDRQLLEVVLQVLALQRAAHHEPQADREALARADADDAGAAVAVGFQELGAFAPQQRHVRFARRRGHVGKAGLHRPDAGSSHLGITGELVDEAAQDHGIRVCDRILDRRIVSRPQLRP